MLIISECKKCGLADKKNCPIKVNIRNKLKNTGLGKVPLHYKCESWRLKSPLWSLRIGDKIHFTFWYYATTSYRPENKGYDIDGKKINTYGLPYGKIDFVKDRKDTPITGTIAGHVSNKGNYQIEISKKDAELINSFNSVYIYRFSNYIIDKEIFKVNPDDVIRLAVNVKFILGKEVEK